MKNLLNNLLGIDSLLIVANILLVIFLHENIIALDLILLLSSCVMIFGPNYKKFLFIWLFCLVFGSVSEMIIIYYSNAWQYKIVDFINIPSWLSILWGMTGLYLVKVFLKRDQTI